MPENTCCQRGAHFLEHRATAPDGATGKGDLPATKRITKLQRRNIMTKVNKWTLGLAAVGLVSLPSVVQAEEKPNQLLTALSSTMISGYVDTSAHWTMGSGNNNPPGYAYNLPSKQDGFNLNVVDVTLEKPLDEGTWSAGYKVELWFGPNATVLGNNIGDTTPATAGGGNDLTVKQAYVALRVP